MLERYSRCLSRGDTPNWRLPISCRYGASVLFAVLVMTARHESSGESAASTAPARPATLFAVGDLMYRTTSEGAVLVGALMERLLARDPVNSRAILAGDICNDDGQPECYERLEQTHGVH